MTNMCLPVQGPNMHIIMYIANLCQTDILDHYARKKSMIVIVVMLSNINGLSVASSSFLSSVD